MKLEEALKHAREGKKIRPKNWDDGCYVYIHCEALVREDESYHKLDLEDLESTDWEIFGEKESTSHIIKWIKTKVMQPDNERFVLGYKKNHCPNFYVTAFMECSKIWINGEPDVWSEFPNPTEDK